MVYEIVPNEPEDATTPAILPRVFVREPGWSIAMKAGSDRAFCYQVAPGETAYHRLGDGELFVFRGDERLCLPCADRRGLLAFSARGLRDRMAERNMPPSDDRVPYDVMGARAISED